MRISYDESGFECNLQQSKPHISASRRKTITNHWYTYTSNWRNEDGMKQTFLNIPHYAFYDNFGNGLENITTKSSNCLGVECIHAKMVGSFQNISLPRASSNSITNSLLATPWIRAICTLKLHLQFRFHATIKSNFCHAYQKFRRPCSCHFQFRHLTGERNQKWERDREIVFHCYICMENKWIRKCSVVKFLIHRQSQSKCLHIWNVKCVPRVQKVSLCFPATRAISRENCMDLSFRCIERDSARWTFLDEIYAKFIQ